MEAGELFRRIFPLVVCNAIIIFFLSSRGIGSMRVSGVDFRVFRAAVSARSSDQPSMAVVRCSEGLSRRSELSAAAPLEISKEEAETERLPIGNLSKVIAFGGFDSYLTKAWARQQDRFLKALADRKWSVKHDPIKILLAIFVTPDTLDNAAFTLRKLLLTAGGDEFKVVLLYSVMPERGLPDLSKHFNETLAGHVIGQRVGQGCNVGMYQSLVPTMVEGYDYLWLLDGHLLFDYFDWRVLRHYLVKLNPVVVQPAIIPFAAGMRGSDYAPSQMRPGNATGDKPTISGAWETEWVESLSQLFKADLWPALYARAWRVSQGSGHIAVGGLINSIAAALWSEGCVQVRGLVVNLAPLRRVHCPDFTDIEKCGPLQTDWDCRGWIDSERDPVQDTFRECVVAHGREVWLWPVPYKPTCWPLEWQGNTREWLHEW